MIADRVAAEHSFDQRASRAAPSRRSRLRGTPHLSAGTGRTCGSAGTTARRSARRSRARRASGRARAGAARTTRCCPRTPSTWRGPSRGTAPPGPPARRRVRAARDRRRRLRPEPAGRRLAADVEALLPAGADRRARHRGQVVRRPTRGSPRCRADQTDPSRAPRRRRPSRHPARGHRRRQPPAGRHHRHLRDPVPAAADGRRLRHRGHPDVVLAGVRRPGGSRRTGHHDGVRQGARRRAQPRGVPGPRLRAHLHRPRTSGPCTATTTWSSSRRATSP